MGNGIRLLQETNSSDILHGVPLSADLCARHMTDSAAQARYAAYSKLQTAAVASGENFFLPEIVAVGGQSDGKSSLLEAFLGFRFNVREVEMGTRRSVLTAISEAGLRHLQNWQLNEQQAADRADGTQPRGSAATVPPAAGGLRGVWAGRCPRDCSG